MFGATQREWEGFPGGVGGGVLPRTADPAGAETGAGEVGRSRRHGWRWRRRWHRRQRGCRRAWEAAERGSVGVLNSFDDCSAVTRALLDSSGNGIHAVRKVSTAVRKAFRDWAVDFNEEGDRVEVLNAPQFALDCRLAVAAWVNPRKHQQQSPGRAEAT